MLSVHLVVGTWQITVLLHAAVCDVRDRSQSIPQAVSLGQRARFEELGHLLGIRKGSAQEEIIAWGHWH
jgi:hypothetical protein